jgi:hypothetical protein
MLELVDWIDLAQDRDKRSAGVNKVMYLFSIKLGRGIFWLAVRQLAFQKALCSVEVFEMLTH